MAGLRTHGLPLNAFTLHADHEEHERRIDNDTIEVEAAGWRRRRRADYDAALGWLSAGTTVIDTTHLSSEEVVASLRNRVWSSKLQRARGVGEV